MLGRNLEKTLRRMLQLANERQHEYATIETLLLALLEDPDAHDALVGCGADVDRLRESLTDFLKHDLSSLVVEGVVDAKPTAGVQRIIQRAAIHVESQGRDEVTGSDVLVALFSERESHGAYFLQEQDLSRLKLVQYLQQKKDSKKLSLDYIPDIVTVFEKLVYRIHDKIVLVAETSGQNATLEDTTDALETIRLDVNWSWRVSEAIWRLEHNEKLPYWAHQTMEQLKRAANQLSKDGKVGLYLNEKEFDPLEDTFLHRPIVNFSSARHTNPIWITIGVTAASLTVLIMASLWSLRTWKKMRNDDEFATAKTELLKHITSQITCKNPKQLKEIETLLLGLLSCPNGIHERGDEISISIPHLLSARVAKEQQSPK